MQNKQNRQMVKSNAVINGLAGAVVLAGATQAYGTVVNVAPPQDIVGHTPTASDPGTQVAIDLDGDGIGDVDIAYRNVSLQGGPALFSFIYVAGASSTGAVVGNYIASPGQANSAYAYSLPSGYRVGSSSNFYQANGYFSHLVTNYKGTNYGFTAHPGQAGVAENVGFRFSDGTGQLDYGYLQLETDPYVSAADPGGIKFLGLAYDDSGAPIIIPNLPAVPEPSSLAALALGPAGGAIISLKRRRAAAKAAVV